LLPLRVGLRVRSQHPCMLDTKPLGLQRRGGQRQPVPQVASQQSDGVGGVLTPMGVHLPPPRERAIPHLLPRLARLDTSRALVLQGFHPASHPLHPSHHRSSLLMTEAGKRRLRERRQLGTDLPQPLAQLFSRRRNTCIGDQRHPRSPPFRPASTSTHQQALNYCSIPAYSLCETTDTLPSSDPPPTPPPGELLTAARWTPASLHRRQHIAPPTREGAVDNVARSVRGSCAQVSYHGGMRIGIGSDESGSDLKSVVITH